MEFKRIAKILQGLVLRRSLTRHINLDAVSGEPFMFLPNTGGKILFQIMKVTC